MVDTVDSKSAAKRRGGSIPLQGIKLITNYWHSLISFNKRMPQNKKERFLKTTKELGGSVLKNKKTKFFTVFLIPKYSIWEQNKVFKTTVG